MDGGGVIEDEEAFSWAMFCAASRILVCVASFLRAPRRVMIELCAPGIVAEVRMQLRRQVETGHATHAPSQAEVIDLFWVENIFSLGCPPSSLDVVVTPGADLGTPPI